MREGGNGKNIGSMPPKNTVRDFEKTKIREKKEESRSAQKKNHQKAIIKGGDKKKIIVSHPKIGSEEGKMMTERVVEAVTKLKIKEQG